MTNLESKLKKIISSWFLKEPLLFATQSTHSLIQNPSLSVPMRTGKKRIEYSPAASWWPFPLPPACCLGY